MITLGNPSAPIYVVCEPPGFKYNTVNPCSTQSLKLFLDEVNKVGFKSTDFFFIQLCEPIPENIKKSDSKKWAFVAEHLEHVQTHLANRGDRPVVTMGDLATRAVMGRKHSIMNCRGTLLDGKVFPILSPAQCLRVLEHMPMFKADLSTLKRLYDNGFDLESKENTNNSFWCTDLQFLVDNKPKIIAVDTETTGLRTTDSTFQVLTVQIGYNETDTAVIPLHPNFWPVGDEYTDAKRDALVAQLRVILEDPSIRKVGHNINYDRRALKVMNQQFRNLGIVVKGWLADTQLLAATIDENMYSKSLDDCARRFVPDEAGYNDVWNQTINKEDMIHLDRESMLAYAGGDSRVTLKLFWVLWAQLRLDPKQYNLFVKLKMPGLLAFELMEEEGICVDKDYLAEIKVEAAQEVEELHTRLINEAPKAVLRKHIENNKDKKKDPLRLSRDALVRDILFSPEGFNLKPFVFTDTTKDNEDKSTRIPSVSSKHHLPFFLEHEDERISSYIQGLIEYAKLDKLNTTYIQNFYDKFVHADGKIHPQFLLHRTNTSRSSSANPNAQNFPARGKWAKKYKKIFKAKPGYKFVSADLSQIELRLVAWESKDNVMMEAYRTGKDIHKITAMAVLGVNEEQWAKLSKDEQKLARFRAKAVNFGFVYGMRPKKFKTYAKTDYNVNLTDAEADQYYNRYHNLYRGIRRWHDKRISEVHQNGSVVSLLGYRRNLPSIYSDDIMISSGAERNAVNSPIQEVGSDLGVLAIARIARQVDPDIICPVAFIHDDIILQVKDGHEAEALNMLLWVLANPPLKSMFGIEAPLPIFGEPDVGLSLGEMYELYDLPDDAPEEYKLLATQISPAKPVWWNDEKDLK